MSRAWHIAEKRYKAMHRSERSGRKDEEITVQLKLLIKGSAVHTPTECPALKLPLEARVVNIGPDSVFR